MKNRVDLIGNLGKDVEVKKLDGGKTVLNFSIATVEHFKDKTTGEKKDITTWHECAWWAEMENLVPYLTKGSMVNVVGSIKKGSYEKDVKGEKVEIPTFKINVIELFLLNSTKEKEAK